MLNNAPSEAVLARAAELRAEGNTWEIVAAQMNRLVRDVIENNFRLRLVFPELFGPIRLAALKDDRYLRITTGRLPEADFALIDEVATDRILSL